MRCALRRNGSIWWWVAETNAQLNGIRHLHLEIVHLLCTLQPGWFTKSTFGFIQLGCGRSRRAENWRINLAASIGMKRNDVTHVHLEYHARHFKRSAQGVVVLHQRKLRANAFFETPLDHQVWKAQAIITSVAVGGAASRSVERRTSTCRSREQEVDRAGTCKGSWEGRILRALCIARHVVPCFASRIM